MRQQHVELRIYGRVGQRVAQATVSHISGVYYVCNIPHLTLESAALAMLEQGPRMEEPANEYPA